MAVKSTFSRRLIGTVTMFLVSGLSLLLLMYVGFGEAQRGYQQFHLERLTAQGRIVQSAMNTFLRPGLPMKQYVGFTTLAERIIASDDSIASLITFDQHGQPIFTSGNASIPLLPKMSNSRSRTDQAYELRQNEQYLQVVLPLRSRFEIVGSLAITMPRSVISDRVKASFQPLLIVALALSIAFALFVSIGGPRLKRHRTPWLQILYAVTFLTMAVVVISTLVSLYSAGAQAKTQALANSLEYRLKDIVAFELNIGEIDGLDRTFAEYRRLNPDISAAGLTINGQIQIHTDPNLVGKVWTTDSDTYEYIVDLTPPGSAREIRIAVALPTAIVYRQIARSVKNFAALFVASAFLAGLFLQLAGSVQRPNMSHEASGTNAAASWSNGVALDLVKPVFFVAVFLEHLNYAFLPQFMHQLVADSGLSSGYTSAPFMAYYLCFALALIPAGHFTQQVSSRQIMYVGLLLAGAGLFILALPPNFSLVMLARSLSGLGQGILFIGVQSYILAVASPRMKTQGTAIIVFGFQGGMISGMAIGSLLVTYIEPAGVFTLSGSIAFALALYAMFVVPTEVRQAATKFRLGRSIRQVSRDMGQVLRNLEFLTTITLIGIPAKAVLTGIIIFALPLLLAQREYPEEDIGQIIMVYAAGVILATSYASRLVDRTGQTHTILFLGAILSGLGLLLLGLVGWEQLGAGPNGPLFVTVVLICGVAIIGGAHGFINAPVVTHVADLELATRIDTCSVTATYRFLERVGHIAGPIIVSQVLLFGGQSEMLFVWAGAAIILLGLLFLSRSAATQVITTDREIRS